MFESIRTHFGRRRLAFLFHYLLAMATANSIKNILPIIEKSFDHPWVTRVELGIRFSPGRGAYRLWPLFKSPLKNNLMYWDAPVTVSVFRKRRGKERQALCMSLYIRSGVLYIAQLQGVAGTDVPVELRAWAKMFIEACKEFACRQGLREVRVPKAKTLDCFEQTVPRIRRNMELLYDANALRAGLAPDGDWFKWQNPRSIRGRSPAELPKYLLIAAASALRVRAQKGNGGRRRDIRKLGPPP